MRVMVLCFLVVMCFFSPPAVYANSCQNDERFNAFDFWLGEWRVTTQDGAHAGVNLVQKHPDGCYITEHWTSASGSTGFSINYFNPVTEQWRQVWVSSPGIEIDYTGGTNERGEMQLEGVIYYYQSNTSRPFRGTWTPAEDGTVRQVFEQFNPSSGEWELWFDGLYTKSA